MHSCCLLAAAVSAVHQSLSSVCNTGVGYSLIVVGIVTKTGADLVKFYNDGGRQMTGWPCLCILGVIKSSQ